MNRISVDSMVARADQGMAGMVVDAELLAGLKGSRGGCPVTHGAAGAAPFRF
ncbi:hypothetical protein [Streptomyces liliifuscus]|uniref:Uncharacterized protein n=1 Tax=Streptomyces liliifuscus TaxID=2797636 RepID=A0A7T7L4L7_9ACTN|nr:hypothetical protein [Streptomyces liliifuscus]QQM46300.1 hypothetical protein JEQ17_47455 [Streptomyces liliifuscus]